MYLAHEGARAEEIFYIEAGAVEICYSRRQAVDEDLLDDAVRPTFGPGNASDLGFRQLLCQGM